MATDLPLIDVHTHAMPLPLLRRLVAEVGCDRVLVGTDAPFGLLPAGRTDVMAAP